MVFVMALVFTRHDNFNGSILLRNQAYEIALQLREIQLSSVSAERLEGAYRSIRGVHFATVNPYRYYSFEDADGDNYFDSTEQLGQVETLDARFEIREIRAIASGATVIPQVSVIFERPDFDARFFQGSGSELTGITGIEIDIARVGETGTSEDVLRTIEITATGQVSIQ